MRSIRAAACVAILMTLAACTEGQAAKNLSSSSTLSPRAGLSSAPGATTNPLSSPAVSSPRPIPTGYNPDKPCDPVDVYSANAGVPGNTYIRAVTRPAIDWGPGCEVLNAGDVCRVKWDGSYVVTSGDHAYLTFQAWAKGSKRPFKSLTLGPLGAESQLHRMSFRVTVPRAAEVAFRLVLRDQAKAVVAISDSFSYLLNCRH